MIVRFFEIMKEEMEKSVYEEGTLSLAKLQYIYFKCLESLPITQGEKKFISGVSYPTLRSKKITKVMREEDKYPELVRLSEKRRAIKDSARRPERYNRCYSCASVYPKARGLFICYFCGSKEVSDYAEHRRKYEKQII